MNVIPENKKVLIPVAWPYANGPRHIGHVAGFGVPSDVYARYMRAKGYDVLMISGTDEHGTPILVQSEEEGVSPQELSDRFNNIIVDDLVKLGLSYDLFTRTTTANHYKIVQDLFLGLYNNGYMIEKTQKNAVDPKTKRTLPDRYIEGICPLCGANGARGDQCDTCGNQLDAIDLINPKSKIDGTVPEFVDSNQFFLDLPALKDALENWLKTRKDWRPNVIKFSLGLLKDIEPRAMTRDIDWGVPVPIDGWRDLNNKRLYVWFDAVIGYLSASIEWARRSGDDNKWRLWWNDPDAVSNYFMGKDNITFHSQIWPAQLLGYQGLGDKGGTCGNLGELNLPTNVVSSEFLSMEGKKFSSSRGIVIYVKDFLERYQSDALRYYISIAGPENNDTDFTWQDFYQRTNSELVASWGNLVNRVANMIAKNFGEIPPLYNLEDIDKTLLDNINLGFKTVGDLIEKHHQKNALTELMRLVAEVNTYISQTEPFKLKNDILGSERVTKERLSSILHVLAQSVIDLNTMFTCFLPFSANKVYQIFTGKSNAASLPVKKVVQDLDNQKTYPIITGEYKIDETFLSWKRHEITVGTKVEKPEPIFIKLDESIIQEELARMQ